jgi:hypothetical protein
MKPPQGPVDLRVAESTDETNAFRQRWQFYALCGACGAAFELFPNVGLERMKTFQRLCVFVVPEVCPECKSLRAVGASSTVEGSAPVSPPEGPKSA